MRALLLLLLIGACARPIRSTLPPTPVEVENPPVPPEPEEPARKRTVVTWTSIEILPTVTFVGNTAELTDGAKVTLAAFAVTLNNNPGIALVEVRGHSDSREDRVTRAELSTKRAEVVVAFLVAHDVNPARLVAYGASDTEPISFTDDEANRRIELIILDRI